jgi:hypothetical protein
VAEVEVLAAWEEFDNGQDDQGDCSRPGTMTAMGTNPAVDRPPSVDPAFAADAARILRAVLDELPPTTPTEVALARRIEGAVTTFELVAGHEIVFCPCRTEACRDATEKWLRERRSLLTFLP